MLYIAVQRANVGERAFVGATAMNAKDALESLKSVAGHRLNTENVLVIQMAAFSRVEEIPPTKPEYVILPALSCF